MTRFHASWVVPITSRPIRRGWVEIDECTHRVTRLGSPGSDVHRASGGRDVDLTGTLILPSLVNTHTHLELSGLRTLVPPAESMPTWARFVLSSVAEVGLDESQIRVALDEARAAGTGLVGDITNTLMSVVPLMESSVDAVVFKELLGFNEPDAIGLVRRELAAMSRLRGHAAVSNRIAGVELGLAAHAPYSVSPALFRAIRSAVTDGPLCVHLAESREELQFLGSGDGPWRAVLEERGRWDPRWEPFDGGPVAYLDRLGWLTPQTIVVHGVHLTDPELERLAAAGVTLATCPRSNRWTGAGTPPIGRFYASGVRVAIGTDSLASVPDLNLFAELAEMRRLAPDLPASNLLRSATRTGAEALGRFDCGSIAEGMQASLITVSCTETVEDVEEYLVNGIEPEHVRWLDES